MLLLILDSKIKGQKNIVYENHKDDSWDLQNRNSVWKVAYKMDVDNTEFILSQLGVIYRV